MPDVLDRLRSRVREYIDEACHALADRLPERTITGQYGEPYLSKYKILDFKGTSLYLHYFHRGDEDSALHNHPWEVAVSLILTGGYREEYRDGNAVKSRILKPGSLNLIPKETYHRVDLLSNDAWTLCFMGREVQPWGFWNRATSEYTPWREFIRRKGLVPLER